MTKLQSCAIINYAYNLLEILRTFAAVPNKARVVDIFCNWRLVAILQVNKTTRHKKLMHTDLKFPAF